MGRTADLLRAEFFHYGTGVGARDRRGVRLAGDYRDLAHGLRTAGVEASQWRVEESGMPADAGTVVRSGPAEFTGVAPHQAARAAGGTADGAQRSTNGDERFGRTVRASAVAVAGRRGRGRQRVVPGVPGPLSLPALPRSVRRPPALPGAFRALSGTRAGMSAVDLAGLETGPARPLDWMERRATGAQSAVHRQPQSLPDTALGAGE